MAETKPTAATAAKSSSSVQPKKKGNTISWVAPLVCIIAGYLIWRFIIGADSNFSKPDPNGVPGCNAICPDVRVPADFRDGAASAFHAGYCVRHTARPSYLAPTSEQTTY